MPANAQAKARNLQLPGEENAPLDRLEAATAVIGNADAVVRFAARGCGAVGTRPVAAPLADPTAVPNETHVPVSLF